MYSHNNDSCFKVPGQEHLKDVVGIRKYNQFGMKANNNTSTSNVVLAGGLHLFSTDINIKTEPQATTAIVYKSLVKLDFGFEDDNEEELPATSFKEEETPVTSFVLSTIPMATMEPPVPNGNAYKSVVEFNYGYEKANKEDEEYTNDSIPELQERELHKDSSDDKSNNKLSNNISFVEFNDKVTINNVKEDHNNNNNNKGNNISNTVKQEVKHNNNNNNDNDDDIIDLYTSKMTMDYKADDKNYRSNIIHCVFGNP